MSKYHESTDRYSPGEIAHGIAKLGVLLNSVNDLPKDREKINKERYNSLKELADELSKLRIFKIIHFTYQVFSHLQYFIKLTKDEPGFVDAIPKSEKE